MKIRNNILLMLLSSTFLSSNCWAEASFDSSLISSDYLKLEKDTSGSTSSDIVKIGEDKYKIILKETEYEQDGSFTKNTAAINTILNQTVLYKYNPNYLDYRYYNYNYSYNFNRVTVGDYGYSNGGAFYNSGDYVNISLDAINNEASYGGGLYNSTYYSINSLTGKFIGNQSSVRGGAIDNRGYIYTLNSIFLGNSVISSTSAQGGAIWNDDSYSSTDASIGNITGAFIGNYVKTTSTNGSYVSDAYGGAIYNKDIIQDITADFAGNYAEGIYAYGGAIFNHNTNQSSYNMPQIGSISGNFIKNYAKSTADEDTNSAAQGGFLFNLMGSTENISGNFIGNYVDSQNMSYGGAIANKNSATIQDIDANFYGNYAKTSDDYSTAYGGAILNLNTSSIGNITGNFGQNYVEGVYAYGGAIINYSSTIGDISGAFADNTATTITSEGSAQGGAIFNVNNSSIGDISADFSGNSTYGESLSHGGAIANKNSSIIKDITGNFYNNKTTSGYIDSFSLGGAIYNYNASIEKINGNFIQNASEGTYAYGGAIINWAATINDINGNFTENTSTGVSDVGGAQGGAILNVENSSLKNITGDFSNNTAIAQNWSFGGAIANKSSTITSITGDFKDNMVMTYKKYSAAHGGAIYNDSQIDIIEGVFEGNHAEAIKDTSSAYGGAIYNKGSINSIINSDFINNYTKGVDAKGGAIYSETDLYIEALRYDSLFSGNTSNEESNAIYMQGSEDANINLTLSAIRGGSITFDDAIDGVNYNINIDSDSSGIIKFNEKITGLVNLNLNDEAYLHIGSNADIEVSNISINPPSSSISTLNLASSTSPVLQIDVDVVDNKMNNGLIKVSGDISGTYGIIINALSEQYSSDTSAFLEALNDDNTTTTELNVLRVKGSPYMWKTVLNAKGETQGSTWHLDMDKDANQSIIVSPEIFTGIGLHEAAIEQTRSIVKNVSNKVASTRRFCNNCDILTDTWNGTKLHNAWVVTQSEDVNIEKPVAMEGKIWSIEAGFDIQNDIHNAFGAFTSYRNGEYDLSGKGSKYTSSIGSAIAIDSYLAGLYYRYDKNNNWLFTTAYAGIQDAKLDTNDNIVNFKTDGTEFGASAELGKSFVLNNKTTLSPSFAIKYNQISFDKTCDNVSKNYNWDDIKYFEAELALSLEKQLENGKVYVKPSVIQTITKDDNVSVKNLGNIDTYKDGTLGRVELGGNSYFNNHLSGYGWTNYTYGANYDAIALSLGIVYNW